MLIRIKNFFGKIKQRKLDFNYITEAPPVFSLSPEFKPLTYDQRELLFYLVKASKKEAYNGEFQWCISAIPDNQPPLHFIVGVRPVEHKSNIFNLNYLQNKEWHMVSKRAQMKSLEDGGYISMSSLQTEIVDTISRREEVWVNFCLNQKAFDYYRFISWSPASRLLHILWVSSQNHFVSIIISIISGVIGAILINWLSSSINNSK
jgi:hypothetical protein